MSELETTERVTHDLLAAIGPVIEGLGQDGDEEAVSKVGPVLLTTGVMLLVQSIGSSATATIIGELALRVERGDFEKQVNLFTTPGS